MSGLAFAAYLFDPCEPTAVVQPLTRGLWLLCALVLLPCSGRPVEAQQRRYLLELGAGVHASPSMKRPGSKAGSAGSAELGLWLPAHFSVEVEGSFVSSDAHRRTSGYDGEYQHPRHHRLGAVQHSHRQERVGAPEAGWRLDELRRRHQSRPDLREQRHPHGRGGPQDGHHADLFARGDLTLTRNSSDTSDVSFTNVGVSLGLSYMLGARPSPTATATASSRTMDRCPDTPAGAQVDGTGCPSDSDADGVPDGVDRCANTAPGAEVDATGCTQDSDSDNIPDGLDRCPDTESGVLVDPNGCPRDSDGDAIPDGLDRCSETPKGATVDALGCPGDEDGDGVLDGLDRCPRTPTGTSTNATGCPDDAGGPRLRPAPQRAPPPARTSTRGSRGAGGGGGRCRGGSSATRQPTSRRSGKGHIAPGVIPDVAFATGSARLLSQSYVPLDSIAQILKADTTVKIEVGAHTDNTGAPSEAERLTNLQAEAVRDLPRDEGREATSRSGAGLW